MKEHENLQWRNTGRLATQSELPDFVVFREALLLVPPSVFILFKRFKKYGELMILFFFISLYFISSFN